MAEPGADIRSRRLELRMSQAELAARAGVSRATISNAESGEGLHARTEARIRNALGGVIKPLAVTGEMPLFVLPLPADAALAADLLAAAGTWWQQRYGEPLMLSFTGDGPLVQESTPYGFGLVLRDRAVAGFDGGDADTPQPTSEDPAAAPATGTDNTTGGG